MLYCVHILYLLYCILLFTCYYILLLICYIASYYLLLIFYHGIRKITKIFVSVTGFESCSPSPCKNGGLCVSSPRDELHCKWVATILYHFHYYNYESIFLLLSSACTYISFGMHVVRLCVKRLLRSGTIESFTMYLYYTHSYTLPMCKHQLMTVTFAVNEFFQFDWFFCTLLAS